MNYSTPITPPSTGGGTGTVNKITFNGVEFLPDPTGNVPIDYQGFSGAYEDLTGKPVLFSGNYSDLVGAPVLATVATSGSYNDLTEKPVIPAAQVNSDWDATTGVAQILNKPTIPTVPTNVSAFINDAGYLDSADIAPVGLSGNYADLINKPDLSPLATAIQNASNVGTGTSLFSGKTGTNLDFRTLRAGDNVTLSVNAQGEIVIASAGGGTVSGEANTSSSLGTGVSIVAPKNGVDLPFRSLLSSAGLAWSQETNTVTLTLHTILQAWANLTLTANTLVYATGAGTLGTTPLTAFARTLLDDANAAAMQNTLALALVASSGSYADLNNKPLIQASAADTTPGALMVVGAGGLLAAQGITPGDLDSPGSVMFLNIPGGSTGNPFGAVGATGIHVPQGANWGWQIAGKAGSGVDLKVRGHDSSAVWSSWHSLWHEGNFDPTTRLTALDPTATGKLTVIGSAENLRLQAVSVDGTAYHSYYNGNGSRYAYIGKGGSTSVFYINIDTLDELRLTAPIMARVYIGGSVRLTVNSTGLTVVGTLSASSDRKFKKNIRKLSTASALSRLLALKAKSFFFTLVGKDFSGFIAQEVQKVYPNSVTRIKDDNGSHLVMTKDEIIADLVVVVQDQQKRLDRLEAKLNDLTQ